MLVVLWQRIGPTGVKFKVTSGLQRADLISARFEPLGIEGTSTALVDGRRNTPRKDPPNSVQLNYVDVALFKRTAILSGLTPRHPFIFHLYLNESR